MNKSSSKSTTVVIVVPHHDWVDYYWSNRMIQNVSGIEAGLTLLDWTLAGIDRNYVSKVVLLCHSSQVESLSHIKGVTLTECDGNSLVDSLVSVFSQSQNDVLYIYPWVVFRKEFFSKLCSMPSSDIVIASNRDWLNAGDFSYQHRVATEKVKLVDGRVASFGRMMDKCDWHAAFSGIAWLSDRSVNEIVAIWDRLKSQEVDYFHDSIDVKIARFSDFVQELIELDYVVSAQEINDDVVTLQKTEQLAEFIFGTKAQTLQRLRFVLEKSNISDLLMFTVSEWRQDQATILSDALNKFDGSNVVVRSSSIVEDGWDESLAGAFYSVLDVDISKDGNLESAIADVISSYKKVTDLEDEYFDRHQVLIQKFVSDIDISGVIFTRDLHTGTPYYIINYDAESGRTDSVTSGDTNNLKTLVVYRDVDIDYLDEKFKKLILSCKEVEESINCDSLDIEFAISNDGSIHIFQVRPMAVANAWDTLDHGKFTSVLEYITNFVHGINLSQGKTVFSNMTDWNPAEMISTSPSPLAMSLYEYLITDSTWRDSRGECGYYNPPSERLMVSLGGKPYINTRSSFNSFVPESIPDKLREELVNHWINHLVEHPDKHDKVEFEIVPTCYTFDFDDQLSSLLKAGVEQADVELLKRELLVLTDAHISQNIFKLNDELKKVSELADRVSHYESREFDIRTLQSLLDDCRDNGVLPFSNLARMAFIATAILRSLGSKDVLSDDDQSNLKASIHTITSEVIDDFHRLGSREISIDGFLSKYGHLRPGTYDINSRRYDEDPGMYLHQTEGVVSKKFEAHALEHEKLDDIDKLLKSHGFESTGSQLITFIKDAIKGREDAKFGFTKAVSLALKMIESIGSGEGVSRSDMAYVDVHSLLRWDSMASVSAFEEWLKDTIHHNKEMHMYQRALNLPDIVTEFTDVHIYHQLQTKPNFVTKKKVVSDLVCLDDNENQDISNKIVMIESSDPGFDWIFTHNISGLITMYGGANSHMAIRCAEFNIPAAIGCGQAIYDLLSGEKMVEIDCAGEIVRPCAAH